MATRRVFIWAAAIWAMGIAGTVPKARAEIPALDLTGVQKASAKVELVDGAPAPTTVVLERNWLGETCYATLHNTGDAAVALGRVVLLDLSHSLPSDTGLYGEGFTMLSQTGGTLGMPENLGDYTDAGHYKIPQPPDATTVYGLLTLSPPGDDTLLLGFSTCRRFVGKLHVRPAQIEVALDTEGLILGPGERWEMEDFVFLRGSDRNALLANFASRIGKKHPPLAFATRPSGWCSWYCYGPMVTEYHVQANLDAVRSLGLPLRFIQIDDGYQAAMGDWLQTGKAFGGGVRNVLQTIRTATCEPAIWVAPFVAEEGSEVFRDHPDWFIQDADGKPLRSDTVTFGGWRRGPWYALDGTHPGAQAHLEETFRTMRQEWGCRYFKLDANFWGTMHGGHFHDPKATRVEAYRRGMAAVLRGAGDGFVLGCNHPLWPSLGLIHGSRSSGDISRDWKVFQHTARENFNRNWQNNRLWWNDPDCLLLTGKLSEDEFQFHASAIHATGGMLLSGDNLSMIPDHRLPMLRKLLSDSGRAAQFGDAALEVGIIALGQSEQVCFFNWGETPKTLRQAVPEGAALRDFWSDADLGISNGTLEVKDLPPHAARVIVVTP